MHGATSDIVGGLVALMLLAAATLALTNRLRFPFSIALLLLGMLLAQLGLIFPQQLGILSELEISADLILYVFLPTLVFESAFHLDWRQLRRDLAPVLMLAVPGLLASSLLIAGLLNLATGLPFSHAWLLGAILSATDPVAVIALFRKLGAPQRLTILVEGESLFNDASAIVLSRILVGVALAGSLESSRILSGLGDFVVVFFGGVLVGWLLGELIAWLLGKVQAEAEIEITLTTVLAYLSFLIAEEVLHVSGVMATVTAGLSYGHRGWMRVSSSVRSYLEHFWEYMAFVSTALIFLMVGLAVDVGQIVSQWQTLSWLILGMLLSRAAVVYGLMPVVNRMPDAEPVGRAYQHVMYWGGLRGAIALAIVLSLPEELPFKDDFIALVAGALLFTLLVQGLSINRLVQRLGLDRQPLIDRFGIADTRIAMARHVLKRLPELRIGGLFSSTPIQSLLQHYAQETSTAEHALNELQEDEFEDSSHRAVLNMRILSEERRQFARLFDHGHLAEQVMRLLLSSNAECQDGVRQGHPLPAQRLPFDISAGWSRTLLNRLPGLREKLALRRLAIEYQAAWALYQSSTAILADWYVLLPEPGSERAQQLKPLLEQWRDAARTSLEHTAEQFPEFTQTMQQNHAKRLALLTELEVIEDRAARGSLCTGAAESLRHDRLGSIAHLRGLSTHALRLEPAELLRQVPIFHDADPAAIDFLARAVTAQTLNAESDIIRQHEPGESLFLIARGVVRVLVEGQEQPIATLMAGDFFGEMALLHQTPRTATVRSVTPCTVYELSRPAYLKAAEQIPSLAQTTAELDDRRRAELEQLKTQSDT